jgi:hypothetical protein
MLMFYLPMIIFKGMLEAKAAPRNKRNRDEPVD